MVNPRVVSIEIVGEEKNNNISAPYYYIKSVYTNGEKHSPKDPIHSDELLNYIHKNKPIVIDSRKYNWYILQVLFNYNYRPLPKEFFAYNEKTEYNNQDNC